MTSVNYIKDDTGSTFIPSSQRPDGTWRKPIRVKDGYVPQEEQPLYVSKGKQDKTPSPYPVGLSPADVSTYSSSSRNQRESSHGGSSSLYFDVGLYTVAPVAAPIPGLNFVETPEADKTSSKSKSKKSKNKNKPSDLSNNSSNTTTTTSAKKPQDSQNNSQVISGGGSGAVSTTDPVKRLRNLRKRLKDIEALEKKIESGELKNPEKEQLEKIQRKDDVCDEIDDLESLIERLNLS